MTSPLGRRWLRIVAVVFVGLLLAYPVAANPLLALGGVQKMFEGTDQVKVDFPRAWSLWPGHVHVEQVRLTMQDRNVEFSLELAHADVEIALRDLFHRTLHATKVRGDGVVFRFRHRIDPESADAPWCGRFLPSLNSRIRLCDMPMRPRRRSTKPTTICGPCTWRTSMSACEELWAQMFRYEGEARVRGAFRLRPANASGWSGRAYADERKRRAPDRTT